MPEWDPTCHSPRSSEPPGPTRKYAAAASVSTTRRSSARPRQRVLWTARARGQRRRRISGCSSSCSSFAAGSSGGGGGISSGGAWPQLAAAAFCSTQQASRGLARYNEITTTPRGQRLNPTDAAAHWVRRRRGLGAAEAPAAAALPAALDLHGGRGPASAGHISTDREVLIQTQCTGACMYRIGRQCDGMPMDGWVGWLVRVGRARPCRGRRSAAAVSARRARTGALRKLAPEPA
jgi:hypothetical protein